MAYQWKSMRLNCSSFFHFESILIIILSLTSQSFLVFINCHYQNGPSNTTSSTSDAKICYVSTSFRRLSRRHSSAPSSHFQLWFSRPTWVSFNDSLRSSHFQNTSCQTSYPEWSPPWSTRPWRSLLESCTPTSIRTVFVMWMPLECCRSTRLLWVAYLCFLEEPASESHYTIIRTNMRSWRCSRDPSRSDPFP